MFLIQLRPNLIGGFLEASAGLECLKCATDPLVWECRPIVFEVSIFLLRLEHEKACVFFNEVLALELFWSLGDSLVLWAIFGTESHFETFVLFLLSSPFKCTFGTDCRDRLFFCVNGFLGEYPLLFLSWLFSLGDKECALTGLFFILSGVRLLVLLVLLLVILLLSCALGFVLGFLGDVSFCTGRWCPGALFCWSLGMRMLFAGVVLEAQVLVLLGFSLACYTVRENQDNQ